MFVSNLKIKGPRVRVIGLSNLSRCGDWLSDSECVYIDVLECVHVNMAMG